MREADGEKDFQLSFSSLLKLIACFLGTKKRIIYFIKLNCENQRKRSFKSSFNNLLMTEHRVKKASYEGRGLKPVTRYSYHCKEPNNKNLVLKLRNLAPQGMHYSFIL